MTELEAMEARHSVRAYTDRPIEGEKVAALQATIDEVNAATGLHIQLNIGEPQGFSGVMAHYGSFRGVRNYIVMAGPAGKMREVGYYGEKIVLAAQMLGLNTCWVALTFNKRKAVYELAAGEEMYVVISLGYGETAGNPHRSKAPAEVAELTDTTPDWFRRGVEAALLAPTAINQQRFRFALEGDTVTATCPKGAYTEMDLGIAQYHFDLATGGKHFGMGL